MSGCKRHMSPSKWLSPPTTWLLINCYKKFHPSLTICSFCLSYAVNTLLDFICLGKRLCFSHFNLLSCNSTQISYPDWKIHDDLPLPFDSVNVKKKTQNKTQKLYRILSINSFSQATRMYSYPLHSHVKGTVVAPVCLSVWTETQKLLHKSFKNFTGVLI